MDPRPGERVDHPHHVGMWFNYGDVNSLDFWNNSTDIPAEKKSGFGIIKQTSAKRYAHAVAANHCGRRQ